MRYSNAAVKSKAIMMKEDKKSKFQDMLPAQPPFLPVPRFIAQKSTNRLCQDMIDLIRKQQEGKIIIEEFKHFNNEELNNIIEYLKRQICQI